MPHQPLTGSVRVHLTASEAYPALETMFLNATSEVWASFLVFDLDTALRSDAGRAVGRTWFDLLVHVLRRGVKLHFVLADVDPVVRADMHRAATRSLRRFVAAREVAGPAAELNVVAARHPAQSGAVLRLAIWPYIQMKLKGTARRLNHLALPQRVAALRDMPGMTPYLRTHADGRVAVRRFCLPRLYPALHHQKLAVFDRSLLYIGGLDLDERRYDTPKHNQPAAQTWHDLQLIVDGPVVTEAQAHLETFRAVANGDAPVATHRRLLTTLSQKRPFNLFRFGPATCAAQISTGHSVLVNRSTRLIYLETQYFRNRALALDLARRAQKEPGLTMILVLPAAPDDVAFEGNRGPDARFGAFQQARALRIIRRAFGPRLFIASPAQQRRAGPAQGAPKEGGDVAANSDRLNGAPMVYVHAKVSVFDDNAAIVSSANLNGRSLFWDTEAGVYLYRHVQVEDLRRRVMAHWLPENANAAAFALDTAAATWARISRDNARTAPEQRKGFLLPHDFAAAELFGRPLPMVPDELV